MPLQYSQVNDSDELPVAQIPPTPRWVENFCWHGYDLQSRVGAFVHLGRWPEDPDIWREQVFIFWPDGSVGVFRNYGRGHSLNGPAGSMLKAECLETGQRWRLRFHGPVWRADSSELLRGVLTDRFPQQATLDLTFEATTPILMYPHTEGESWGSSHYEQVGAVTGAISVNGEELLLERSFAYRDHSRGPRDLSRHTGSSWIQGLLPDGSSFSIFGIWQERDGEEYQALDEGTLITSEGPQTLDLVESAPRLRPDLQGATDSFDIAIKVNGEPKTLRANIAATMPFALSPTFDWVYGARPGAIVGLEQPIELVLDGQRLDGYCERTIRLVSPQTSEQ